MTNAEVVRRLESVTLPDIALEGHRRELRATLLREYAMAAAQADRPSSFGFMRSRTPVWRTVVVTSTAWALVTLAVTLAVLIPAHQPESTAVMAVNTVLASQSVKTVLANDEMAAVTVTDIENKLVDVMVESRGGNIIIARVDTRDNTVTITEITYIVWLGSPYDAKEYVTGNELEKVIDLASTNSTFRELLGKGGSITGTTAVYCVVSTRRTDSG